ncbi:MAG: hypothetical protein J3K34DRAFT_425457 [Monoraphidium minutum]|nr:MAG: hypothetical protein J3K34DRAFT_425457 [Monoraphidium minutum]
MSVVLMKGMHISPMFGHRKNWHLLAMRGSFGAVAMLLSYCSIQMLPLGDAITIGLISPPITAVAARLVLKEPLGIQGALGCLVSIAGVLFVW